MPHCIILSILSTQRLISNETNLNDIETTPNTIYVHLYIYLIYFHQSYLYDLCDEDDVMILLISYNLCKSSILLGQTTTEYNELYIRLIEHNFKLTKIHAYASCLFLLESDEAGLNKLYNIRIK
ncbi:unnamed protein product [Rotaria sp. Silwood1]|nr:unnamed protein product [Rotaria sp. Silwood1]